MRSRNIKPGFYKNEDLADCEPLARILYTGLWCYADREGRFEWRPKRMKVEILPYDTVDIPELLEQLTRSGMVKQYNIDGKDYGCVKRFLDHQTPHYKEKPSVIPPPKHPDTYQGELEPEIRPGQDQGKPKSNPSDVLIPDVLIHKDRKPGEKQKPSGPEPEKRTIKKTIPGHFSIPSGEELEKRLKSAGHKIEAVKDTKSFKPFQWIQKMFNLKYHPLAITEIIEYMADQWSTIEKPFAFGESSLKIRSGNYYEKDHKAKADVEAGVFNELVDKLRRLK